MEFFIILFLWILMCGTKQDCTNAAYSKTEHKEIEHCDESGISLPILSSKEKASIVGRVLFLGAAFAGMLWLAPYVIEYFE